ncbi:manganese and iron superoxide dismutase [Martensiomyces pterosporus]|nr:manganese and iron superoxide dismutase [Martensiomyces pterosporus]
MFRVATRTRSLAQPLMQRVAKARFHQPALLPYDAEKGLAPFLSAQSLDFLYKMRQVELINNVNRLSEGTDYETKSLLATIYDAAQDPSQTALQNNASQAWGIDFFLQSLTAEPRAPREDTRRQIAEQFGSFERFKETFTQSALALFGNGWTWLVMNESGQLSVMSTFNAGTPFTAIPSSKSAQAKGVSYSSVTRNFGRRPFVKLAPVLGLSMWQEAFLPDYGLDREAYVKRFWDAVNWQVVHERLMNTRSGSQTTL